MKDTLLKKTLGMLALGSLGLMAGGAQASWAHDPHGHNAHAYRQSQMFSQQIDARQERQMARLQAGAHEGRLSRFEFRRLMHEQREIRTMERHFLADGIIDAHEFRRLDRALDSAGRNIWADKHGHQERYAYNQAPWRE